MQDKEKMFLDLNSVLVKFWIENNRPDKAVKIELLERMLNWYKKMGYVTLDKQEEKKLPEELEEAMQHDAINTYAMPKDGDIEKVMKVQKARILHEIGFKAGAEWGAEQKSIEIFKRQNCRGCGTQRCIGENEWLEGCREFQKWKAEYLKQ